MEDSKVRQVPDKAIKIQEGTSKSCAIENNTSESGDVQVRHGITVEPLEEAIVVANPGTSIVLGVVGDVSFELLGDKEDPSSVGQGSRIVWWATRHKPKRGWVKGKSRRTREGCGPRWG